MTARQKLRLPAVSAVVVAVAVVATLCAGRVLASSEVPSERPTAVAGVVLERPDATDVWALVIGIDDYTGTGQDLLGAGVDADAAIAWLDRVGVPKEQRRDLRDAAATSAGIESGLEWLAREAPASSMAVVVYAGHARLSDGQQSVVGADLRPVSDDRLAELVAPLRSSTAWFVMASCYGGGFTEWLDRPGRALTAAASSTDEAFETDEFGQSYLTEFLFDRVLADGSVPPAEAIGAGALASGAIVADRPDRALAQAGDARVLLPLSAR